MGLRIKGMYFSGYTHSAVVIEVEIGALYEVFVIQYNIYISLTMQYVNPLGHACKCPKKPVYFGNILMTRAFF